MRKCVNSDRYTRGLDFDKKSIAIHNISMVGTLLGTITQEIRD